MHNTGYGENRSDLKKVSNDLKSRISLFVVNIHKTAKQSFGCPIST